MRFTPGMSAHQENHHARYASIAAGLIVAYFLLAPVLSILFGKRSGAPDIVRKSAEVLFFPAAWLYDNSDTYKRMCLYEWELMGLHYY
ncbi:MAG: hypothetical protein EOP84_09565 [Verrucomicrobiaceae bacterium]|nr:MAG: hypothetical protein EOP84_09565 [Verrucomicrobiaceae bacterium]